MKRGIIFTNKKHPKIAIMSTVLGGISIAALLFAIISSFVLGGSVPKRYGMAGLLAVIYSLVGAVLALYSFKIKESFHLFSVIGLSLNGAALLFEGFLLWIPG